MSNVLEFCNLNNYPQISLEKEPNVWHKLEDATFKGSYVFKQLKFADKELIILTVYDFRSGESKTERFGATELSKGETLKLNKVLKEQEEEFKKEKGRQHERCKKYANEQFSSYGQVGLSENPYTLRKLLGGDKTKDSFGLSVYSRVSLLGNTDLVAPITDFEGTLWNYQTITESGDKQILIGGKYQGLFIPIIPDSISVSELGSCARVYVVEGYSTGLSVFLALDKKFPVLCAISSTNIYNVVSELRARYEKIPYIICADNDCWKRDNPNTGKISAEQAVSRIDGGAYVLPDFSGLSEAELAQKPTDYNDLHSLRGIDEVRAQLGKAVLSRPRVIYPLGYNNKTYFFTTSKVPQIQPITDFSETDLFKLAPQSYWVQKYPTEKGNIDLSRIKSELIDTCQSVGLFESHRLRGRGVYLDNGKFVLHKGDKVVYLASGEERDLADMKSAFYYDPRPSWSFVTKPPDESLLSDIHKALERFSWSNKFEAMLCLGWLLTAPLAGSLAWRSHLAITAEAASGKTTLLQALSTLLTNWQPIKLEGTTEASLRQSLGTDAIPVLLDEQDTNSLDPKAFDKILTLFRLASSEGEVRRGTVSGKALKFNACFSGLIAGINLPRMKHADTTRFCVIELDPNKKSQSWSEMQKDIEVLFRKDSGDMLSTWVRENVEKILHAIEAVRPKIEVMSDARTSQQYSNLVGAAGFALGLSPSESVEMLAKYWKEQKSQGDLVESKDSDQCLDHLLNLQAVTDQDRRVHSLGRVLEQSHEPSEIISQFDMKIVEDGKLFVPNSHPILSRHFGGTPWHNWNKTLKRTGGAEQRVLWVNGKSVRGLTVPVKLKEAKF
jgi:putative DNA primase/helicase